MKELSQDAKIIGTQAWLLDHNLNLNGVNTYKDAQNLISGVTNARHLKLNTPEGRPKEFKMVKDELEKYFGYSKDELKNFKGSGGYLNATAELNSLLVNTVIFLTNAQPADLF